MLDAVRVNGFALIWLLNGFMFACLSSCEIGAWLCCGVKMLLWIAVTWKLVVIAVWLRIVDCYFVLFWFIMIKGNCADYMLN